MPRKTIHSKFSGELNTPIKRLKKPKPLPGEPRVIYSQTWPETDLEEIKRLNEDNRVRKEKERKLPLLFEHYNIDPADVNAWMNLALGLADDYVPGFYVESESQKIGRDIVWNAIRLALLWIHVYKKTEAIGKKNAKAACRNLMKQEPWKEWLAKGKGEGTAKYKVDKSASDDTLYNRYLLACKSDLVQIHMAVLKCSPTHIEKEKRSKKFHETIETIHRICEGEYDLTNDLIEKMTTEIK